MLDRYTCKHSLSAISVYVNKKWNTQNLIQMPKRDSSWYYLDGIAKPVLT